MYQKFIKVQDWIDWLKVNKQLSGIYKITSPTNRLYVGSAEDILERFKSYRRGATKNQKKIHRSLKKHGPENHIFEILEVINETNKLLLNVKLDEREIYWGLLFNVLDKENLTLKLGGRKTQIYAQELKDRIGETQRINNLRGKAVLQYTDTGEFIREWPSIKAAVKGVTGKRNGGGITSCCRGITPRAYGFIWRLKEGNLIEGFKVSSRKIPISQYSAENIFIRDWESARAVWKKTDIDPSTIRLNCLNKLKTAGGFIWKYKN